jgi:hypothetical protein
MKRIAAAPLWFFVGWFVGSAVAWAFGLGAFLAPMTAVVLAGIVVVDPRGVIWSDRPTEKSQASRPVGTAEAHTS